MNESSTFGHIEADGIFKIHKRDQFMESLKVLCNGKYTKIELIVRKMYNKRSTQQNRYYWGYLIIEFCNGWYDMTGELISKEQAHEFLKGRFNFKEEINYKTGEILKMPLSTAELSTVKYSGYNDRCGEFIEEYFGRKILKPNEQADMFDKPIDDARDNNS